MTNSLKAFLIFLLIFFSSQIKAETSLPVAIEKIQKYYDGFQDIQTSFTQKIKLKTFDKEVNKQGMTAFKKPGKFKVEYLGENARLYLSNGKKLWIYQKGEKQVQSYVLNDKSVPSETLAFLGGLGKIEKDFKISFVTPKEKNDFKMKLEELIWLRLKPKNPQSKLALLYMGFNSQNYELKEAWLKNESENYSHYIFSQIKTNQNLKDSDFEFTILGVKEIKGE